MGRILVLDCTLRDGGCVNDFNFGNDYMNSIITGLQLSGVDAIECGYIDECRGSKSERTQFIDEESIEENLLKTRENNIIYLAMTDLGKYNHKKLPERSNSTIDGIRLAFHKEALSQVVEAGKIILSKGYMLFVQPMLTIRYTDKELLELISLVNNELPNASAFYIVDSFGEMRAEDVKRLTYLVNHNLNYNIAIGFHSHNNLQLSYANAVEIINMNLNRDIFIDASILGMGKGAGNLNTELLMEYMNIYNSQSYNVQPLLKVIDEVLNQIKEETPWGYSIEYYLSSINHCTPSYAAHLYNKHMLTIEQISDILSKIEPIKKISFDKKYIENLYIEYGNNKKNDDFVIEKLRCKIENKDILLIAPGKSILKYQKKINDILNRDTIYSISINGDMDFDTNITVVTKNILELEEICHKHKVIVSSNVRVNNENVEVIDYDKWINRDGEAKDAAVVIIFNIIKYLGAKKVYMAGFDGFSVDINDNYYNKKNRRPMKENQVIARNIYIQNFLKKMSNVLELEYITPSIYQE